MQVNYGLSSVTSFGVIHWLWRIFSLGLRLSNCILEALVPIIISQYPIVPNAQMQIISLNSYLIKLSMSSQTDLTSYLQRFVQRASTKPQLEFPPSRAPASQPPSLHQISFTNQNNNTSTMSANTALCFQRAQVECLEELQQLRNTLQEQQKDLMVFLQHSHQQILSKVRQQHNNIKEEFVKMVNTIFEMNAKRIDQALIPKLQEMPVEVARIRRQIQEINQQIDRLQQGLKGQKYKKVIAEVVTSDFGSALANLQVIIKQAKDQLGEKSFNLALNAECYKRIKQDLMNMYLIQQTGPSPINGQKVSQSTHNDHLPHFGSAQKHTDPQQHSHQQGPSVFQNAMNMLHLKREQTRNKSPVPINSQTAR